MHYIYSSFIFSRNDHYLNVDTTENTVYPQRAAWINVWLVCLKRVTKKLLFNVGVQWHSWFNQTVEVRFSFYLDHCFQSHKYLSFFQAAAGSGDSAVSTNHNSMLPFRIFVFNCCLYPACVSNTLFTLSTAQEEISQAERCK